MPRAASKGRGRPPKKASPAKKATPATKTKAMAFTEGDAVLAKWPGTALFFRAKVTFVREDDQEYDVKYEDGTVFTIKAKDVEKQREIKPKATPTRSRSRGRSPGRGRKAAAKKADESAAKADESPAAAAKSPATPAATASSRPSRAAKPAATPTRQSARIAEKREFSADPAAAARKAAAKVSLKERLTTFISELSFEWISCLIFTALSPFILVSLHTLCTPTSCKPALPFDRLPRTLEAYWDPQGFIGILAFTGMCKLLFLLPLGSKVKSPVTGNDYRMNGFLALLICMAVIPVLVYKKVNLSVVSDKYYFLMTSSIFAGAFAGIVARIKAYFSPELKKNWNPEGNTGNPIVDICKGREMSPSLAGRDAKLELFRVSMTLMALLNIILVVNSIMVKGTGEVNPVVVLASSFQVLYALDALFFEEYFFLSHDYMNSGFGLNYITSYLTFPFVSTLITQYLIVRSPVMKWYYIFAIASVNAIGYIIFRASESQRCEFSKDPDSIKNLETITGTGGKKLLVSGWWGIVRHPNYLGELLIQWSWVLPAACTAGKEDLLVYYLPIMTTLVVILRMRHQNAKNKRKFGAAWTTYCERVRSNLIPKVF